MMETQAAMPTSGTKDGGAVRSAGPLRISMLSIHSSPLGELGTQDTGGMSVYVRELSRELGRAGHTVDIYTCAPGGPRDPVVSLSEGVRLIRLDLPQHGGAAKSSLTRHLPDVFQALESHVATNRTGYDVIHSHYWLSGCVGRHARDAWCLPHVVMFHTTGMAKRLACWEERETLLRLVAEKRVAHGSDRVLAATDHEKNLIARYYAVPPEKIGVVPCGVNLDRFRPLPSALARRELGIGESRSVILYVGRFAPVKGIERVIAAASHLRHRRELQFLIVGGDGQSAGASARLIRLARSASVDGMVKFHGRVDHDLLPLYYSAADALVVPSYYESFGLVGLESLACGTPVIATRVGAMNTLVKESLTGLLIDAPTPRSLAETIGRYLDVSSQKNISREEIRASVLRYGWANVASAVAQEYAMSIHSYSPAMQPC